VKLFDPEKSQVVLIGISNYDDPQLPKLKAAEKNLEALKGIFVSESIGINEQNITTIANESNKDKILLAIHQAASKAKQSLVLYYAGHGVLDENYDLYLTHSASTVDEIFITGIQVSQINNIIKKENLNVVLILDCCFSEKAFESFRKTNYAIIASSKKNTPSKYPLEEQYSAFSNELIAALRDGINLRKKELSLRDIFLYIQKQLKIKEFPEPRQVNTNNIAEMIFCKNNFDEISPVTELNKNIIIPVFHALNEFVKDFEGFSPSGADFEEDLDLDDFFESEGENYEESLQLTQKANQILRYYPILVSDELRKVFAPSDENVSRNKMRILNLCQVNFSVIKFIAFVLLAQLWDEKSHNNIQLSFDFSELMNRFDNPENEDFIRYIIAVNKIFKENNIKPVIPELGELFVNPDVYRASRFLVKTYATLSEVASETRLPQETETICIQCENALTTILEATAFLSHYGLVSVRNIHVIKSKTEPTEFSHRVNYLQLDSNNSAQTQTVTRSKHTDSHSVLLIRDRNFDDITLNLSPFIVDRNAKTARTLPSIFYYERKAQDEDVYLYRPVGAQEAKPFPLASKFDGIELQKQIEKFKQNLTA
jgi:hypothetical protein